MKTKSQHKRRTIWWIIPIIGVFLLSVIIVPPMINLNSLKPNLENVIYNQTGITAKIHGNVNFSLLGQATIIAHNISVPNGVIQSFEFAIPWHNIFNMKKASISGDIVINGASLFIEKIVPFDINETIVLNNSKFEFLNKTYDVVSATLSKNYVNALVRTDQHKYEIKSVNNNFVIQNKNNDLNISGELLPNGTAIATIDITAQNINRWFEFEKPKITGRFPISANVFWDGGYGFKFSHISANGVTGEAILQPDGYKIISLKTNTADYDMSFILKDIDLLKNSTLNLNLHGKIKFLDKTFSRLTVNIVGSNDKIQIIKINADDLNISGGYIDKNGAHNVYVSLPENNIPTTCIFNGTPTNWSCTEFSYNNDIFGNITVKDDNFDINVNSKRPLSNIQDIINSVKFIGTHGTIKFDFPNMSGIIHMDGKRIDVKYNFVKNHTLKWADINLPFIPEKMLNETGNFVWDKNSMIFIPDSKKWNLTTTKDYFYISGDNFKKWFSNLDLQSIKDLPYTISGNYKRGNISNLDMNIAGHKFIGSVSNKTITLKTDILNLDSFISTDFTDNFEELSFFTPLPITIPFDIDANVSLSAKALIYKGQKYDNFVYSLKQNKQTFSISDSNRGNMLATISKNKNNYDIQIQLNKFLWDTTLLKPDMPLNVSNTMITAEINLKTSGKIANDVINNIHGKFDASLTGGYIYGLGLSKFYSSAQNINILNAEYALSSAIEDGITQIKKMHIIGEYNQGNINTTSPFTLTMKHSEATGTIDIKNNQMFATLNLLLRGTSPSPTPIEITVLPNGHREYSLSEIMMNFDTEYMRSFIKLHDKF